MVEDYANPWCNADHSEHLVAYTTELRRETPDNTIPLWTRKARK